MEKILLSALHCIWFFVFSILLMHFLKLLFYFLFKKSVARLLHLSVNSIISLIGIFLVCSQLDIKISMYYFIIGLLGMILIFSVLVSIEKIVIGYLLTRHLKSILENRSFNKIIVDNDSGSYLGFITNYMVIENQNNELVYIPLKKVLESKISIMRYSSHKNVEIDLSIPTYIRKNKVLAIKKYIKQISATVLSRDSF